MQRGGINVFAGMDRPGALMQNPEFSLWERWFCFGHKKSAFCPDVPLRPVGRKLGSSGHRLKEQGLSQTTGRTPKLHPSMPLEDIVR